jgi:hypothetical protein
LYKDSRRFLSPQIEIFSNIQRSRPERSSRQALGKEEAVRRMQWDSVGAGGEGLDDLVDVLMSCRARPGAGIVGQAK